MKVFYTAKGFNGETRSGEAEVKNERDLVSQLRGEGFIVTSFKEIEEEKTQKAQSKFMDKFFGIPLKDKLMFTRNIGVMVASGVPLSRAVKNISAQTEDKRFAKILDSVYSDIQSGLTFSDSLAKYPAIFNDLFVNMVRVGESSGNLEEVLDILANQLEKEHDLISRVKGAMTYPAVIMVVMFGTMVFMFTYIMPKITKIFKDMKVPLPASTQFIISASDFFMAYKLTIGIVFLLAIVIAKFYTKTESGKKMVSFLAINIPLVSTIVVKVNCARFCRVYSSLLKSGVSVLESLKIVSNTLTNHYYKKVLSQSIDEVQKGINLSTIIGKNPKIFPILVTQMLEVGEETGKTDSILLKLAEFYEEEVNQLTKNMSSIIEPILMVMIGSAVGFFAVSMLQPMYSVMRGIK